MGGGEVVSDETRLIRARAAGAVTDHFSRAVVFAENPDGSGQRLEIQRSIDPTDEDRALGQDTYCVTNEEGIVHYGGVRRWEAASSRVTVEFDDDAASEFGARTYLIELASPTGDNERAVAALRELLDEARLN